MQAPGTSGERVITRYENRKLYDAETKAYVTLEGLARLVSDGQVVDLGGVPPAAMKGPLDVLVDRISLGVDERERLADSLEMAMKKGGGRAKVRLEDGHELLFSDKLECKSCRMTIEDPYPNLFSFNSPQGACPGDLGGRA